MKLILSANQSFVIQNPMFPILNYQVSFQSLMPPSAIGGDINFCKTFSKDKQYVTGAISEDRIMRLPVPVNLIMFHYPVLCNILIDEKSSSYT